MRIHFKVVTAATVAALVFLLLSPIVHSTVAAEATGVLESFLEIVGGIYSVLTAFVIFVVWEQFNALQKLTVREGTLAAEVPRLAGLLGAEHVQLRRRIGSATRAYLDAAATEWDELAVLGESRAAVAALDTLETRIADAAEASPVVHGRLSDAVAALRECRVSRVSAAKHRMPPTLSRLLAFLGGLLLAAVLAMPVGGQPHVALVAFTCLAAVLTMIRAVIWDIDHPFVGVWNVSRAPFEDTAKSIAGGLPSVASTAAAR